MTTFGSTLLKAIATAASFSRMFAAIVCALPFLPFLQPAAAAADAGGANRLAEEAHDYCVLGAGPAGLQVGQLMLARGYDYVIIERSGHAGSFFARYVHVHCSNMCTR